MSNGVASGSVLIQILESPSPEDIYNGQAEGRALSEALSLSGVKPIYNITVDLDRFMLALIEFFDRRVAATHTLSILHLSMHGNDGGVVLTDGQSIDWQMLRTLVINASEGDALLAMSTCFGFHGCQMAMMEGELPFAGIVGHPGPDHWDTAAVGYIVFYHRLIAGDSFADAVAAMQAATGEKFIWKSAKNIRAMRGRMPTADDAAAMRATFDRLIAQISKRS